MNPNEWRSRRLLAFKKVWEKCRREMTDIQVHLAAFERALDEQDPRGPFSARLVDIAQVRTGIPRADFWLQRRGTDENVGRPTRNPQWSQYNIGITVKRLDLVVPDYLYYWFEMLWMRGYWRNLNYGTLQLRHIRTSDVCSLRVTFNP
jgi:hypothetical protein